MNNLDVRTSGLLERSFLSRNFRSRVDHPNLILVTRTNCRCPERDTLRRLPSVSERLSEGKAH